MFGGSADLLQGKVATRARLDDGDVGLGDARVSEEALDAAPVVLRRQVVLAVGEDDEPGLVLLELCVAGGRVDHPESGLDPRLCCLTSDSGLSSRLSQLTFQRFR